MNKLQINLAVAAALAIAAAVPAAAQTGAFNQDFTGGTGTFQFANANTFAAQVTGNYYYSATDPSKFYDATLYITDSFGHADVQLQNDVTHTSFNLGQPSILTLNHSGAFTSVSGTFEGGTEDFQFGGITGPLSANGSVRNASATFSPVPEASTMLSFGAMLLLGGLFAVRQTKRTVKTTV